MKTCGAGKHSTMPPRSFFWGGYFLRAYPSFYPIGGHCVPSQIISWHRTRADLVCQQDIGHQTTTTARCSIFITELPNTALRYPSPKFCCAVRLSRQDHPTNYSLDKRPVPPFKSCNTTLIAGCKRQFSTDRQCFDSTNSIAARLSINQKGFIRGTYDAFIHKFSSYPSCPNTA